MGDDMTTALDRATVEELLAETRRLVAERELPASSKGHRDHTLARDGIQCWWEWTWEPCGVGGSVTIKLGARPDNYFDEGADSWCRPDILVIVHRCHGRETRLESNQRGDSRIDCLSRPSGRVSYLLNRLSPDNVHVIET